MNLSSTLTRSVAHAFAYFLGAASVASYAANTPSHFSCSDSWIDPDGNAINAVAPKGLEATNSVYMITVPEVLPSAQVTMVYSYNSRTQTPPNLTMELLGSRVDGANVVASVVYPLRFFDPIGSDQNRETTLNLPKPSPGDYRLNIQIPYGCSIGTAATLPRSGGNSQWILRIVGSRPTVIVSTMAYLPASRNFMTASLDEVQFLRATPGIGASFALLEDNFRAWATVGDAPPAVVPVCRFFRASTITHAYSADAAECAAMKANPQWSDEGVAFRALVPTAGACASGTEPIYKLTNAALGDTQRYTRSEMTYRTLQLNGWTARGVAFCSPVG